ncbi:hypothetical protein J3R83DRAFT_6611 [Lanmaoa asiatica]|nr:hypothetical protein J3R83DRAFT_6611 [Lanmaoa asiatica]
MAALALHHTRSFFSTFSLPWLVRLTSAPASLASQTPFNLALPMLQPLLDLIPPIVLAVPKNIVNCPACGGAKLAHHACRSCYDTIVAKSRQHSKQPSSGIRSTLSNTTKAAGSSSS